MLNVLIVPATPLEETEKALLTRLLSRSIDPTSGEGYKVSEFNILPVSDPQFDFHLSRISPRVILALGEVPLFRLAKVNGINQWRGYIVDGYHLVVPTYALDFLRKGNMRLAKVFSHDLQKAIKISREGYRISQVHYLLRPTLWEASVYFKDFFRDPSQTLAFDIETPYSSNLDEDAAVEDDESYIVERISFSYKENTAITMPWMPPYIDLSKRVLEAAETLTVYNEAYDVPRLINAGCTFNGKIFDAMWCWHFYQPEWPYGLKYAATFLTDIAQWKSSSKDNPEYYSATDSDALLRVFNGCKEALIKQQRWSTFERHIVDLAGVLRKMSKRGVLVDQDLREQERVRFQERYDLLVEQLTQLVPPGILPHHPKGGFKTPQERLIKNKKWIEGKMVQVGTMLIKEPPPPKVKKPRTTRKKVNKKEILEDLL